VFTGLVQAVGEVHRWAKPRLEIAFDPSAWEEPLEMGESVAVNGVCLTVVSIEPGIIGFDLSDETLERTNFPCQHVGTPVNLERAMRPIDRFGGHIVLGHVDAVAEVTGIEEQEAGIVVRFRVPDSGRRYLIDKGSIALDGVSLTVVAPEGSEFSTWIIPHTWENTAMSAYSVGDKVNVEYDVLAKHVEKLMESRLQ
jgi:riboflavin synthase